MLTLLLAAATLPTAVDAERAFARDAQRIGQWTAFRKYAHPDAVMFTPQAVWARDLLKDAKDPPESVRWWPAASFVSCDGRTAVNTGPWTRNRGTLHGYFTTVWQREKGAWLFVYDGGDQLKIPRPTPARPYVRRAACRAKAPGAPIIPPPPLSRKQARTTPEDSGRGESADKTLGWDWKVDKKGGRHFRTYLWNGTNYEQVLFDSVAAK
ncbi:MAG: DUF4440 domain-containing protein [Sphingomicrobium sp.]